MSAIFDWEALSAADGASQSGAGSSGDPVGARTGGLAGAGGGTGALAGLAGSGASVPTDKDWALVTPGSGGATPVDQDDAVSWTVPVQDDAVSVDSSALANYVLGTGGGGLLPARSSAASEAGVSVASVSDAGGQAWHPPGQADRQWGQGRQAPAPPSV